MNKVNWWESWLMRNSINEKVDWSESQLMRNKKVDRWESWLVRKIIDEKDNWWYIWYSLMLLILGYGHIQTYGSTDRHC